ncbi:sodium:solute symporter family protein [candidate division KSB1 bacterium]|nr:sodium:solute symporter family protein [candidate division KSB1 bacterium]MBL7094188.1 sodium:solute symporter family protein [candidate division KSB1 bacterium]
MNKLHILDLIIIFGYFFFILYIGIKLWRTEQKSDIKSFLLAGRQLTLPSFVATLVSTWYGGILGVGEFSYQYGISNWLVFGIPYYLAAAIFGIFIAKKARSLELYTIPHQLEKAYGKTVSLIGAVFVFIMTVPAAYILMLAVLLKYIFGIPLIWGLITGTVVSTSYVLIGGFRSVIRTDILQFSLMFAGFLILLPVAYFNFGGLSFLQNNLPSNHLIWHGGQGAQYIIVWFFIALGALIEPSFYQRCFAAKTEKVAQRGIFISIAFWIFFDFLTTFTGLYARAILPNLTDPVTSYLALAQKLLPPVFLGLFLTGLLATIMSTIDSYSFLAAMTFGRDFLWRIRNEETSDNIKKYTRLGLILSGILAIVIACFAQSVIRIWKDLGSIGTPALVIPMAVSFFPKLRMEKKFVIVSIIGSALISGIWVFSKSFNSGEYLLGVEPIYPGLGFASLMFIINRAKQRLDEKNAN